MDPSDVNVILQALGKESLTRSRAWFPDAYRTPEDALLHVGMGIAGEAGEVIDEIKKMHARGTLLTDPARIENLKGEMCDLLIYLVSLGRMIDIDWLEWLRHTLEKCEGRWSHVEVVDALIKPFVRVDSRHDT